jgi:GNAT superfamily N-acetyltransferase
VSDAPRMLAEELTREETLALHTSMVEAFAEEVGDTNYQALNITLRDAAGAMYGGLSGATFWNWLTIDILWVDPRHRGRGFARAMMAEAEAEAIRRGCRGAHFDTFSPRAARFYERNGYHVACTIAAAGVEAQRYTLVKTFP